MFKGQRVHLEHKQDTGTLCLEEMRTFISMAARETWEEIRRKEVMPGITLLAIWILSCRQEGAIENAKQRNNMAEFAI